MSDFDLVQAAVGHPSEIAPRMSRLVQQIPLDSPVVADHRGQNKSPLPTGMSCIVSHQPPCLRPAAELGVLQKKMKRIGIIATVVWTMVLASIVCHSIWTVNVVLTTSANHTESTHTLYRHMFISQGRDVLLAIAALLASVFVARSTRQGPLIIMTVVAVLALLLWGVPFVTSLPQTNRTFSVLRPWTPAHSVLLWHAFLEPGVRCLLACVGIACGIAGIKMQRRCDGQLAK